MAGGERDRARPVKRRASPTGDAASAPGGDNLEFDQLSAAIRADASDTDSLLQGARFEARGRPRRTVSRSSARAGCSSATDPLSASPSTSRPAPAWSSRRHEREAASNAPSTGRCAGSSSRPSPSRCPSGWTRLARALLPRHSRASRPGPRSTGCSRDPLMTTEQCMTTELRMKETKDQTSRPPRKATR